MAARLLPDGSYELDFPGGERYRVPEDIARESSPESFPDMQEEGAPPAWWGSGPGTNDAPLGPEPEPELPPWELPQMPQEAPQEMEFSEEEAGFGPPQGMQPGESVSVAESGTGPYQEAQRVGPSAMPDMRQEQGMADQAYRMRSDALDQTQAGMGASMAEQGSLGEERAGFRQETVEEQQRMHAASMAEVERREDELQQALQNVSRMDMGKVWKDSSATVHAAGYLAAGIAGFLNPTGKNSVIEQMQSLADRSAREQAANIALEMKQVEGQKGALGRYERREKDSQVLYLNQRAMLEQSIVDQITLEQQKYKSVVTLGNLEQMRAGALDNLAKTTGERRQLIYKNDFDNRRFEADQRQKTADRRQRAAQFSRRLAFDKDKLAASQTGGAEEEVPRTYIRDPQTGKKVYVDPMVWEQKSDGDKQKWKDKISANHDVAEAVKNLHDTVNKYGKVYGGPGKKWKMSPTTEAYIEINKARKRVIEHVAFAKSGKALSEHELEIFESQMGPIETWLTGGDNAMRHRSMMDTLNKSNSRLYREVGASIPGEDTEVDAPYVGPEGQFDLAEAGDAEKVSLDQDIDVLGAAVDDVLGGAGDEAKKSMVKDVSDQYEVVLNKYKEGRYSAAGADATAKRLTEILDRLPVDLRPQLPLFGARNVASDMESYGAESEGVRNALEALRGSSELRLYPERRRWGTDYHGYTPEQFKQARKLMGLP